jgi:hypothetical protein
MAYGVEDVNVFFCNDWRPKLRPILLENVDDARNGHDLYVKDVNDPRND